ncbi:MAG: 3'-5' exonuclease [Prevotellaceae bacterium]|jgi:DNA polymerase III epsilon subunit-like protein|nr:3'-5' exonuclease [Prevotellaceae bacterium]
MWWLIVIILVIIVVFAVNNNKSQNQNTDTYNGEKVVYRSNYITMTENFNDSPDFEKKTELTEDNSLSDYYFKKMIFEKSVTNEPYFLIFDCETTGKPRDGKVNRIVQLSWIILDKNFKQIKEASYYLNPQKPIPPETTKIHHITDEIVQNLSTPHIDVLNEFHEDLKKCKFFIAHNYEFDASRVDMETRKLKLTDVEILINNPKSICTMHSSVKFCKLEPKIYGEYKLPKLEELAWECGFFITQKHDALSDVLVTARCFEYLVNNKKIKKV